MARWKTIESAPRNISILVDGGEGQTEPSKVRYDGETFSCVDVNYYSVEITNPIYWAHLPTRALDLELPRPAEYDL